MKKVILLLFLFSLTTIQLAQSPVGKGVYTIGGNISFSSISKENSDDSKNIFSISPRVGYFFIDNFYSAIALSYNSTSNGDNSNSSFGFGPSTRYYVDANDNVKPFLGLGYAYTIFDDADLTQSTITLSGGVDFFITKYFAIEGSLNYSFINQNYDSGSFSKDESTNIFSLLFGANYFIN